MRQIAVVIFLIAFNVRAEDAIPALAVPVSQKKASIDGVLDDEFWKDATVMDVTRKTSGEAAGVRTRVLIAQDAQALYIGVEAFEPAELLSKLKTAVTDHDVDEIWQDDSVELFIDPTGARRTFYQLIINASGVYWDGFHDGVSGADKTWQPQCQIVVKKAQERWTAEVRLPWSVFTRTDEFSREWAFNLVRNSMVSNESAYWSPVLGKSNLSPGRFGTLQGLAAKK